MFEGRKYADELQVLLEVIRESNDPVHPKSIYGNSKLMSVLKRIGDFGPGAQKDEIEKTKRRSFEF